MTTPISTWFIKEVSTTLLAARYMGVHWKTSVFLPAGFFFFLVLFTNSCFPVRLEKAREQSDQAPFVWGFFCFGLVLVVGLGFFFEIKSWSLFS